MKKPRKKILHVIPNYGKSGGIERYIELISAPPLTTEFEVILCTFYSSLNQEDAIKYKQNGIEVLSLRTSYFEKVRNKFLKYLLKYSFISYYNKYRSLQVIINDLHPDMLFAHGEDAELISAFVKTEIPIINVIHGEIFFPICIYYRVVSNFIAKRKYDHSIIVNRSLQKKFNLDEKRVSVIQGGVNFENILQSPEINYVEDTCVTFGYLGRLSSEKGILNLIKAFESLEKRYFNIRFEIGGIGKLENSLKKYCGNKSENIHFVGEVKNTNHFFSKIDVLLIASTSEGGPLVLLEAMAAGKIVVATPVGIVPNVIKHGINGYLFASNRQIDLMEGFCTVLENRPKFFEISLNAISTAKKFSQQNMLNDFHNLIRSWGIE